MVNLYSYLKNLALPDLFGNLAILIQTIAIGELKKIEKIAKSREKVVSLDFHILKILLLSMHLEDQNLKKIYMFDH